MSPCRKFTTYMNGSSTMSVIWQRSQNSSRFHFVPKVKEMRAVFLFMSVFWRWKCLHLWYTMISGPWKNESTFLTWEYWTEHWQISTNTWDKSQERTHPSSLHAGVQWPTVALRSVTISVLLAISASIAIVAILTPMAVVMAIVAMSAVVMTLVAMVAVVTTSVTMVAVVMTIVAMVTSVVVPTISVLVIATPVEWKQNENKWQIIEGKFKHCDSKVADYSGCDQCYPCHTVECPSWRIMC